MPLLRLATDEFLMMDRPEEFNREVEGFLSRHKLLRQK